MVATPCYRAPEVCCHLECRMPCALTEGSIPYYGAHLQITDDCGMARGPTSCIVPNCVLITFQRFFLVAFVFRGSVTLSSLPIQIHNDCNVAQVVMSRGGYTSAIDVWSVGCIFGELLQRVARVGSATTPHLQIAPLFAVHGGIPKTPSEGYLSAPSLRSTSALYPPQHLCMVLMLCCVGIGCLDMHLSHDVRYNHRCT